MAKTLTILMLCTVFMLVLVKHNEASVSSTEVSQFEQELHGSDPQYGISEGSLRPQDCGPRCTTRCSATSYKKPCMFFCQKCCAKCLCVPPGTYGNKQVCPCYNNWKTKRGGPKCP